MYEQLYSYSSVYIVKSCRVASRRVVLAALCIPFDALLTFNFTHSRLFYSLTTLFDFYATAASVLAQACHSLIIPIVFFWQSLRFSNSARFHYYDIQSILSFSDFKQVFLALSALYPFSALTLLRQLHYTLSGDIVYA